ncbi:NAD(P)-binding protein [Apiospora marii]|uniref:NAD(P)-binding protein n=1 Tax=Apiospora marii TaxID=335849 RepID=A0ABR1SQ70_9PEZI
MAPTILVVGATGNTGRSTVTAPSQMLKQEGGSSPFAGHRILALTRSAQSPAAQHLATLPRVEVLEFNWADVSERWLREQEVQRAFVASAVDPAQFSTESGFLLAALRAGVEYVVRISTTAPNTYRETGGKPDGPLRVLANPDAPIGVIDADDIGPIAARLLVHEDLSVHNRGKYTINGPEDVTGREMVAMVEQQIGAPVKEVSYKDMSYVETMAAADPEHRTLILSIQHAMEVLWQGGASAATTSKEILEIAAPRTTPAASWEKLLKFLG